MSEFDWEQVYEEGSGTEFGYVMRVSNPHDSVKLKKFLTSIVGNIISRQVRSIVDNPRNRGAVMDSYRRVRDRGGDLDPITLAWKFSLFVAPNHRSDWSETGVEK